MKKWNLAGLLQSSIPGFLHNAIQDDGLGALRIQNVLKFVADTGYRGLRDLEPGKLYKKGKLSVKTKVFKSGLILT